MQNFEKIGGRFYYRSRLYIPDDKDLRTKLIHRMHSATSAGHPGEQRTYMLMRRHYYWPGITKDVSQYVAACQLCRRTKSSKEKPPGLLRPLLIPEQRWLNIAVDYIPALPDSRHAGITYKGILVVIDRLTKMAHFVPVRSLRAEELADAFVDRIYSLHGAPDIIVSDRGTQFVSTFWNHLCARLKTKLTPSTAFHQQTDGQSERVIQTLAQYLRGFVNFAQDDWAKWLPIAEFAINNHENESTGMSPFFANYGWNPRLGLEPRSPLPKDLSAAERAEALKAEAIADRFNEIL